MRKFEEMTAAQVIESACKFFVGKYDGEKVGFSIIRTVTEWENVMTSWINDYRRAYYCEHIDAGNREQNSLILKTAQGYRNYLNNEIQSFIEDSTTCRFCGFTRVDFEQWLDSLVPDVYADDDENADD